MFVSILRLPPECYQTDSDNGSTVGCRNRPTNGCSNRLPGTFSLPRMFFKLFFCSVFSVHSSPLKVLWAFRVFLVTTGMILYVYLNNELHWPMPTLEKKLVFWRHVCSEGLKFERPGVHQLSAQLFILSFILPFAFNSCRSPVTCLTKKKLTVESNNWRLLYTNASDLKFQPFIFGTAHVHQYWDAPDRSCDPYGSFGTGAV